MSSHSFHFELGMLRKNDKYVAQLILIFEVSIGKRLVLIQNKSHSMPQVGIVLENYVSNLLNTTLYTSY